MVPTKPQMGERPLVLADFEYPHPDELVAQTPCVDRDGARLLVRAADGALRHRAIPDLTSELAAGTLLVLNDTRVFPSRLKARLSTGGYVEIFLLEAADDGTWTALARPLKKLRPGIELALGAGATVTVQGREDERVRVRFTLPDGIGLFDWLELHGIVPLPPYIKRPDPVAASVSPDHARYQTIYARDLGSVAAPTAGLHFTERLFAALRAKDVEARFVSLHVGAGTFLGVKTEDPSAHKMHREPFYVGRATVLALIAARRAGRPVVAVGTTTFRTLEQLGALAGDVNDDAALLALADRWLSTELFIYPRTASHRYLPRLVTGLVTNFHQPKSTLFMLICALIGHAEATALYAEAVAGRYRLFSYGDASLLWLGAPPPPQAP